MTGLSFWSSFSLILVIFPYLFAFCSSQATDFQSVRVKKAVDGDTLFLTNGESANLIEVDNHRAFPV